MRLGGAEGGELIKVKSGDFSGKSFRYCNVNTAGGAEDRTVTSRNTGGLLRILNTVLHSFISESLLRKVIDFKLQPVL